MNVNFASVDDIEAARRVNEATPEAQAFACCMRGGVLLPGLFPDRLVAATSR